MSHVLAPYALPRARPLYDAAQFAIVGVILAWSAWVAADGLGYHWQWYRVPRYLFTIRDGHILAGPLAKGLGVTAIITAWSLVLAFALGLATALMRLSGSLTARAMAVAYLETVRNTPLLIQIFFVYFVVSPITGMSAMASAITALSLFEGAYASEIIRSGVVSVDRGQWEAAYSLGLSRPHAYLRVILPQALRRSLPALTGQAVSLVKDSSLASTIAIFELTQQAQIIIADTFLTFEIWFAVAGIYLALTASLSLAVRSLEKRMRTAQ